MTVSAAADFGRYLFVALAVLAPLYALGLGEWACPERSRRERSRRACPACHSKPETRNPKPEWRDRLALTLALGPLALAVYALVGVLAPAYAPPPRYDAPEEVTPQHPVDVTYPGLARLLGYDVASDDLYPGDTLQVTLYWQVLGETDLDYVLFVQVFGRQGDKIGERDTHPGLGRYPTSRWRAGEVIADTIPVPLAADAEAPAALRLDLGLYPPPVLPALPALSGAEGSAAEGACPACPERSRRELAEGAGPRLTTGDGRDTVSVGPVRLAPREPVIPTGTPLTYRLGEGVRLVAWDPEWNGVVRPGETLRFTLYWACDVSPGQPLNVFVHLVDTGGQPLAQGDGPPLSGDYPTDLWAVGDRVADPRTVTLLDNLPAGRYTLLVGLYSLQTGERLPAFDGQATRLPADAVPLGTVEVQP